MEHHLVLRIVARLMLPFIVLFALYVQFHGEYSPGGGFQAGVIFAVAFILYGLVVGTERIRRVFQLHAVRTLLALGLLLYLGVGLLCMARGGAFLDYDFMPLGGQLLGILLVELGVGISVAATMILFFYLFAQRPP